jgi:hypothetical protein
MDEAFHRSAYDPSHPGHFVPDTVFVVISFSPDMDVSYRAIQEGAAAHGLRAQRADDSVGSGIILSQITKAIQDAEFVVVDLTHERPNVYYELGYTHGVGNASADVLLVARAGTVLHFDVGPMRVRFYSSAQELTEIVRTSLGKMVAATRFSAAQVRSGPPSGGVFSLSFQVSGGTFGGGLVLIQRGVIHGGDESYLYLGRYRAASGESIAGELTVRHYRGSPQSILGYLSEAHLAFSARQAGDRFVGEAQIVGRPGPLVEIRGQRVADALV